MPLRTSNSRRAVSKTVTGTILRATHSSYRSSEVDLIRRTRIGVAVLRDRRVCTVVCRPLVVVRLAADRGTPRYCRFPCRYLCQCRIPCRCLLLCGPVTSRCRPCRCRLACEELPCATQEQLPLPLRHRGSPGIRDLIHRASYCRKCSLTSLPESFLLT